LNVATVADGRQDSGRKFSVGVKHFEEKWRENLNLTKNGAKISIWQKNGAKI
jgi:hypothetical protein